MSEDEKTSVWKKEFSFRRKPEQDMTADEDVAGTSFWKKEIGRKKPQDAELEPEPVVVEALEAVPARTRARAGRRSARARSRRRCAGRARLADAAPRGGLRAAGRAAGRARADHARAGARAGSRPSRDRPSRTRPEPELPPVAETPPSAIRRPSRHGAAGRLSRTLQSRSSRPSSCRRWSSRRRRSPAPDRRARHAASDEAPKVPFYKKDFSFKRAPREPKEARANGEKAPSAKRGLSLKRKSQEWDAAEPAAEPASEAPPDATREAVVLRQRRQHEEDRRPEDRRLPDRRGPHPQQRRRRS